MANVDGHANRTAPFQVEVQYVAGWQARGEIAMIIGFTKSNLRLAGGGWRLVVLSIAAWILRTQFHVKGIPFGSEGSATLCSDYIAFLERVTEATTERKP
jgi:hypothetical protein